MEGTLRAGELAVEARRLSSREFAATLGRPLAALVGPAGSTRGTERFQGTRRTRQRGRLLRPETFPEHEVLLVPSSRAALLLGRSPDCDIVLASTSVSLRHAQLRWLGGESFEVQDLGSSNGTLVNEALVLPGTRVHARCGQTLQLGARALKLYSLDRLRQTLRRLVLERPS